MKKYYTYVDFTTEEMPRPFYVGKGIKQRIYVKQRNKTHKGISTKYGCKREIVFESEIEQEALNKEVELVALYKTNIARGEGYWGANFTDGGEGTSGRKLSQETRIKMSEWQIGRKMSQEAKQKMSLAKKGKPLSEEHKKNMSLAQNGRKHSEETLQKMCKARQGENATMFGKKHSEEAKQKMSKVRKRKTWKLIDGKRVYSDKKQ